MLCGAPHDTLWSLVPHSSSLNSEGVSQARQGSSPPLRRLRTGAAIVQLQNAARLLSLSCLPSCGRLAMRRGNLRGRRPQIRVGRRCRVGISYGAGWGRRQRIGEWRRKRRRHARGVRVCCPGRIQRVEHAQFLMKRLVHLS